MARAAAAGAGRGPDPGRGLRELAEWDAIFRALAHASRRHVLQVLRFRGGSMTAGEIAARFSCSWPTTTRHLNELVEAGLVSVEKRGRERIYRLESRRLLSGVNGWLKWFDDSSEE